MIEPDSGGPPASQQPIEAANELTAYPASEFTRLFSRSRNDAQIPVQSSSRTSDPSKFRYRYQDALREPVEAKIKELAKASSGCYAGAGD